MLHSNRKAEACDKKLPPRTLVEAEQELLKAEPMHLVSELNKDELQKRVSDFEFKCTCFDLFILVLVHGRPSHMQNQHIKLKNFIFICHSGAGWLSICTCIEEQACRPFST